MSKDKNIIAMAEVSEKIAALWSEKRRSAGDAAGFVPLGEMRFERRQDTLIQKATGFTIKLPEQIVLQQKWMSLKDGSSEWRDVPVVEEDK